MSGDVMQYPPVRLWLQWVGDAASTTWTDEPVFDRDIEYVRPGYQISKSTLIAIRDRIEIVLDTAQIDAHSYNDLMHALALLPEAD